MSRAAIQGVRGAFSHEAAIRALGDDVQVSECRTFEELFEAVSGGAADFGVVPVENTLAGSVQRNMDLILMHELPVVAETRVRIRLCLVGRPGGGLEELGRAASHPVALQQCRTFFQRHSGIEPVAVFDTAGSIRDLMAGDVDYDYAIGSELAATLFGARVLERDLEDNRENYTRFLIIAPEGAGAEGPDVKTSLAFEVHHEPGALYAALEVLSAHGMDLTRLESRPIPGRPWEYRFYVDLRGATAAEQATAVRALEAAVLKVTVLGSYRENRDTD